MTTRAEWFAQNILPHEPHVRAWLRRASWGPDEIEDLIQEGYAAIASYPLDQIQSPGAFFFQTVRNIATDMVRRRRVVSMLAVADVDRLAGADPAPDAVGQLTAIEDLARVKAAIERLPAACRQVFVLCKIEGLSQAEAARRLGVSQSNIEKHVARGLRLCAELLTRAPDESGVPGMLSKGFWKGRSRHG
jgi:RNA polymerase sigma factor (sigma-70 family)